MVESAKRENPDLQKHYYDHNWHNDLFQPVTLPQPFLQRGDHSLMTCKLTYLASSIDRISSHPDQPASSFRVQGRDPRVGRQEFAQYAGQPHAGGQARVRKRSVRGSTASNGHQNESGIRNLDSQTGVAAQSRLHRRSTRDLHRDEDEQWFQDNPYILP